MAGDDNDQDLRIAALDSDDDQDLKVAEEVIADREDRLVQMLAELRQDLFALGASVKADVQIMMKQFQLLREEVGTLKRVYGFPTVSSPSLEPRARHIHTPEPSSGGRTAKKLDNFLGDMERYFEVGKKKVAAAKFSKPSDSGISRESYWKETRRRVKPRGDCFICQGPHFARECPNKARIDALIAADAAEVSTRTALPPD